LTGFALLLFYEFLDIYSINCGIEDFRLCLNEELAAFDILNKIHSTHI